MTEPYQSIESLYVVSDKQVIFSLVEDVLNKVSQTDLDKDMFLHVVQQFNDSLEVMKSNMVTMFVGGFHTTAFCKCQIWLKGPKFVGSKKNFYYF